VSLLVTELSFTAGEPHTGHAKVAVMTSSIVGALLASAILVARNKKYKEIQAAESVDEDDDGIPDAYRR
jgi:Na+:H+ antiporter, NhaA family